jgi:hypothetical protein
LVGSAVEYIEFDTSGTVDTVGIYAFGCSHVYISVMESGVWQGASTIPYDPIPSLDQFTGGDTPAINYVSYEALNDDEPTLITLPSTYTAEKIRLTITGHSNSNWGRLRAHIEDRQRDRQVVVNRVKRGKYESEPKAKLDPARTSPSGR